MYNLLGYSLLPHRSRTRTLSMSWKLSLCPLLIPNPSCQHSIWISNIIDWLVFLVFQLLYINRWSLQHVLFRIWLLLFYIARVIDVIACHCSLFIFIAIYNSFVQTYHNLLFCFWWIFVFFSSLSVFEFFGWWWWWFFCFLFFFSFWLLQTILLPAFFWCTNASYFFLTFLFIF